MTYHNTNFDISVRKTIDSKTSMTFIGTKMNLHLTVLPGELKTVHFILYKHGIYIQNIGQDNK